VATTDTLCLDTENCESGCRRTDIGTIRGEGIPAMAENRQSVRYPVSPAVCGFLHTAAGDMPMVELVRDISTDGIGLVLDHRLTPGTTGTLNLLNVLNGVTVRVALRVVYGTARPDGSFAHGGTFAKELDPADLTGLL
jgi:hypothetical protein